MLPLEFDNFKNKFPLIDENKLESVSLNFNPVVKLDYNDLNFLLLMIPEIQHSLIKIEQAFLLH